MFFQCPATDYAQSLIIMHNYLMVYLFGIGVFVAFTMGCLIFSCMFRYPFGVYSTRSYLYNQLTKAILAKTSAYYYRAGVDIRTIFSINASNPVVFSSVDPKNKYYLVWLFYNFFYSTIINKKNYEYYSEMNKLFVSSFLEYNSYYKYQYYSNFNLNNVNWLGRFKSLMLNEGYQQQFNGLIHEIITANNISTFLSWENVRHSTKLEIVWTLIPTFILFFVAMPSFSLLYGYDESLDMPVITLKVIGHQWYWSYEYSDYSRSMQLGKTISFDSYMVHEDDFVSNTEFRLLETDTRVVLPVGATVRVLITSGDVIHSWALPSLGTKTDAIPGRLNQALLLITRPGTFFGQCSELCGVQHGFMPIVLEAVKLSDYFRFLSLFYTE